MRVCAQPGCPTLTPTGYCPTHTRTPWTGSDRRKRLPKNWERIRRYILHRDNHTCRHCGHPANQVDHITPGDNHNPDNLQALCGPCHNRKTSTEATEARKR
jgi:5-methylcytosine-specific restriction protein A